MGVLNTTKAAKNFLSIYDILWYDIFGNMELKP
jgi:hypothetical protein